MTKTFSPGYMKEFRCISSQCPDSCCTGWLVRLDERTVSLYRNSSSDIFSNFDSLTFEKDGEICMKMKDGRCPYLEENGLCRIYSYLGFSSLPEICKLHPIFINPSDDYTESGLGLSCEPSMKLILSADAEDYINEDFSSEDERLSFIIENRNALINDIKDEEDIIEITDILLKKAFEIQEEYDLRFFGIKKSGEEYSLKSSLKDFSLFSLDFINFLETLDSAGSEWENLFNDISSSGSLNIHPDDEDFPVFKRLLYYHLFRYLFDSAYGGMVFEETSLSVLLSLAPVILFHASERKYDIESIARICSREIEYNEDNIEKMKDYIFTLTEDD